MPDWDNRLDSRRRPVLKQTRWDLEVDPDCVLPPAERYRRAEAARTAFYVAAWLVVAEVAEP
jgi:hypothetical protein